MKTILQLLILLSSLTILGKGSDKLSTEKHLYNINIAGQQRMLSQRIIKTYIMEIYGIKTRKLKSEQQSSIAQFELNISILKESVKYYNKSFSKFLFKQEIELRRLKWILSKEKKTIYMADSAIDVGDDVLLLCEKTVSLLEEHKIGNNIAQESTYVNKAGRQRMLSQRLAMYFTRVKLPNSKRKHREILNSLLNTIEKTHKELYMVYNSSPKEKHFIGLCYIPLRKILDVRYEILNGDARMQILEKETNNLTHSYDVLVNNMTNIF